MTTSTTKYKFKACIIGQLSPYQKLMTTKFLREAKYPVIAMDEMNAEYKKLGEISEYLIVFLNRFNKGTDEEINKMIEIGENLGFPLTRILVEGESFNSGSLPILPM